MSKRVGKREAYRLAIEMAAAMVIDADWCSLFGDDLMDRDLTDEDEQVLHDAQAKCAKRILSLVKADP